MARLRRLALPGYPYHVTQRGNRRSQTFFEDGDYELYRDLLGEAARMAGSEIWCYCLMPDVGPAAGQRGLGCEHRGEDRPHPRTAKARAETA